MTPKDDVKTALEQVRQGMACAGCDAKDCVALRQAIAIGLALTVALSSLEREQLVKVLCAELKDVEALLPEGPPPPLGA